jgi:ATP-binding cassette subfamily A (ABC1) protein 1
MKSYWLGDAHRTSPKGDPTLSPSGKPPELTKEDTNPYVEDPGEGMMSQRAKRTCVQVKKLRKEFHVPGGKKLAVDGLDLTFYNGQITALLGEWL